MTNELRDVRSHYYEKMGVRGVEEKKVELLLKDNPIDKVKLAQYCLRFPIFPIFRKHIWSILLGKVARSICLFE